MSPIALSAADIDNLSDGELYNALKSHGLNVGPIVASTRGIYKKKLVEKIKAQPSRGSPVPGLESRDRDDVIHHDIRSHAAERSSRNSVERPDSSNRYDDLNRQRNISERKSFSSYLTNSGTPAAYDSQGDDHDFDEEEEDQEEEAERYERHSPPKLSQSYSSYSRHSYGASGSGIGQSRLSDYGRSHTDYLEGPTATSGGSFRSSYGDVGASTVGSSGRTSLGESASARADRILEDIRRRSALAAGYRPGLETDRVSRSRDILEQARVSGRVSKSQTYNGTKKSVLSEYLLKIIIGLVLFACIYFVITSMTQPSTFQAIEQEVDEILKDSDKLE